MTSALSTVQEVNDLAARIVGWQKQHGRHDLPWQNTHDPYAIWVSEIMLQQTQVTSVIGYYQRFMQRFPTIAALAAAEQEEVLQYWSGLGYYSRARNLHAAAQEIVQLHNEQFPQDIEAVVALPGIGRSTAAAITAFAFGQRRAILDGNVKRVLARHFGIEGWPGLPAIEKQMWQLTETLLPEDDIVAYTQGLMDLGATLCKRGKPDCQRCPLQETCVARRNNKTHLLPNPKPRKLLPQRDTVMLLLMSGNEVLLEKRPPAGIWGGLWSLPETRREDDVLQICRQRYQVEASLLPALPVLKHTFSHFILDITPQPLLVNHGPLHVAETGAIWLDIEDATGAALPAPIRKLLLQMQQRKLGVAA
ncbi:MAG TPA: A/G-specific adenine glycosylase [Methylophilaceae bacterium]|nr:A/G-specific adenine glycosylase [Methylophilaceae bacterium]